jgi:ubiquinone/menaquinone biosynthesis C-methylase UbiE
METALTPKTNIEYWEEAVKNSPQSYQDWFKAEREYLEKHIFSNAKILDVACGNGRSISDVVGITQNVIGIDHDESAITDAKNNFLNYPSVQFVRGDAVHIPFSEGEFDFAMCMGSFANFAE